MTKGKILDFDGDLNAAKKGINSSVDKINKTAVSLKSTSTELNQMNSDLEALAIETSVSLPDVENSNARVRAQKSNFAWDDLLFLNNNPVILESRIHREIMARPQLLPPLSGVDYAITAIAASVATIVDMLIVRIPQDVNYMGKFEQKGSGFTSWLRGLGINESGKLDPFFSWMEKTCKVPYDKVGGTGISAFGSRNHRMLSLGHDPLFGLIFGIIDILNGQMSVIDRSGVLRVVTTYTPGASDKIFAPFLWLGHILSDVCTSCGIPIPGWGFTQLLQFGSFGAKNRNVADLAAFMYTHGYDLRHLLTMAISTATIELIIRPYHYLTSMRPMDNGLRDISTPISTRELERIESRLKLHKMLFLAHSCAAGGNAVKVFLHQGNPLAINIAQWGMFLKESVIIFKAVTRDTTGEKIIRNRTKIDAKWIEIQDIELTQLSDTIDTTRRYGELLK